jgi:plastocyanin
MLRTRTRSLIAATAAALVLAACGGGDDTATGDAGDAAGGGIAVTGTNSLVWDVEELEASAGTIDVEITCEDAVNHNFVIEETGEEVAACEAGETATGSVELEAGTYTYICTVPGHETTMRGELVVS